MKKRMKKGRINFPLIILVTLCIVFVLLTGYSLFVHFSTQGIEQTDLGNNELNLTIQNVLSSGDSLIVEIKRNSGETESFGIQFILSGENGDEEIVIENVSFENGEIIDLTLTPEKLTNDEITSISMISIPKSPEKKEKIIDSYSFSKEKTSSGGGNQPQENLPSGSSETSSGSKTSSSSGSGGGGGGSGGTSSGSSSVNPSSSGTTTCSNECTLGAKQCSGTGYQTCGNYDEDSCLEWNSVTSCSAGQTCFGGNCVEGCSDGTPEGTCSLTKPKYCSGKVLIDKPSLCNCPLGLKVSGEECIDVVTVVSFNEQVIKSFDFEETGTTPAGWGKTYLNPGSVFQWENTGHLSSRSLSIYSSSPNDVRWTYSLGLDPEKSYRLSGYIKGENIVNLDGGSIGAHVEISGVSSGDNVGTFDWKKFEAIYTGTGTDYLWCRLGGYSNLVSGKAWFDDLILTVDPFAKYSGENIYLQLENQDLQGIPQEAIKQWVINLDKAYLEYAELVGKKPYEGKSIGVLSVQTYPGGWAVAGNPIRWHQIYVKSELTRISQTGDWSFGIMHEIGHDFDIAGSDRWNFDAEFWANTKMYFVLEILNGKVKEGWKTYTGSELKNYYKTDAGGSYDKTLAKGEYSGDGLTYKFISIKDQIGIEPFKETFRYFIDLSTSQVPTTKLGKFNLFIQKLSDYSGQNVQQIFSSLEWDTVTNYLSTH